MQNSDLPKTKLISITEMQATFEKILLKNGFTNDIATECATIFTQNSVDGIYTHGINRFHRFVKFIKDGNIVPDAKPSLVHQFGGIEQWNGNLGPGPSNAVFATNQAMNLAKKNGIGCVALANTNHWMRGGTYGWQAAKAGFVFIAWTNTIANMPAWGATNPKLGNNPIIFATPYGDEAIVLDMAMSQFSFGALELAAMKKETLSVHGGYDNEGQLTNDPNKILTSTRSIPIGYWKGAGLTLLLDILAAVLANGLATHDMSKKATEMACSQVFVAIDLSKLSNFNSFNGIIQNIIADYKLSVPIDDNNNISYPSERVLKTRAQNTLLGIPVLEQIWEEVLSLH
jgi:3-dehydro-L-gulonate 2-dehydrogenase